MGQREQDYKERIAAAIGGFYDGQRRRGVDINQFQTRNPVKTKTADRTKPHKKLVDSTIAHLQARPNCFAWGNPTGMAERNGRKFRYGKTGCSDVICCYRGHFLGLEVKTGTGQLNDNQLKFRARLEAAQGLYVVVRSIEDVTLALQTIDIQIDAGPSALTPASVPASKP